MGKVDNILDMTGRVAIITGAGQGIGRQIAHHIASYGGSVVVNDYHISRAEAVAQEIAEFGGKALAAQADVGDFDSVQSLIDRTITEFGKVGVLVNNAGNAGATPEAMRQVPFWDSVPSDWAPLLHVNLFGVVNCTRAVLPNMMTNHAGNIVTIISDAGRYGDSNLELYASGKAGAAGFIRSVARTMAGHGIRANCIAIGATRTPTMDPVFNSPELVQKMSRSYPVGRLGEPTDIANMALFLASEAASWITGQTVVVNGGFTFGL